MADSTPTANYGWPKPAPGASDDVWGGYLNTSLDGIDATVHGIQASVPAPYVLPNASTTVLGGVKVDGTTITASGGVISAAGGSGGASLPLAGGTLTGPLTLAKPSGIIGTTGSDLAAAGSVGEVITGYTGSIVPPSQTLTVITSITLTPGDWDIHGDLWLSIPLGQINWFSAGLSWRNNSMPSQGNFDTSCTAMSSISDGFGVQAINVPLRMCVAHIANGTTKNYYILCSAWYVDDSGTFSAGGHIIARRVR